MGAYDGKYIWIIGASSGIGRALAVKLAREGAILALSARREEHLNALNDELGGKHMVCPLDVSDVAAFANCAKTIENSLPRLDSIIFMAAVYEPSRLEVMDIEAAHTMAAVNFGGALNTIHAALPVLKAQGRGQLALCGSVAGYRGLPGGQPYSATKAAIINLAESLRAEEKYLDIKVINPGFVRTPMTDKNDFKMPMIIEPEQAAESIAKGLQKSGFEIHFPGRLTYLLKTLRLLPSFLYFMIVSDNGRAG
jgi:short-subunit dehydrogenase